MEKVLIVDGKEVKLKSTAGTLLRYRNNFNRDLMKDLSKLKNKYEKIKDNPEENFELFDLELFEKVAWSMAKTANNDIPDIEHWLDEFESFSIMQVLPEIFNLLVGNMAQQIESKKNLSKVIK